jgi:hypothetical protein
MQFKEFVSRQRVTIFIVGVFSFAALLFVSHFIDQESLWRSLFINLAASAVTIIFTAFIIDYLGLREQHDKTLNVANLAEDEIKATCFRIKWRMARLFGLERRRSNRNNISNWQEARDYLGKVTDEVDTYLSQYDFVSDKPMVDESAVVPYMERLQSSQNELEQTLILYEYAMSYSLRERILALRNELQIAERLLGFIDLSEGLNKANYSLIRVTAQSVYNAIEEVLAHDSRIGLGVSIQDKDIQETEIV